MSGSLTIAGPTPNEAAMFTALRAALMQYLPSGVDMIRGQVNRVPEPIGPDFLVFWPIARVNLETPIQDYRDGFYDDPQTGGVTTLYQPAEVTVQVDVHGPVSGDTVAVLSALSRSALLADTLAAITEDVAVLYAGEPRQNPFENAESQIEWMWSIDFHIQVNATITFTQDFFDQVTAGIFNVDVEYLP
jgi:hypothetical protein